jgi:hypothetical protein
MSFMHPKAPSPAQSHRPPAPGQADRPHHDRPLEYRTGLVYDLVPTPSYPGAGKLVSKHLVVLERSGLISRRKRWPVGMDRTVYGHSDDLTAGPLTTPGP